MYLLLLVAMFFTMWAQSKVNSTYSTYAKVLNRRGYTGADVARQLLFASGINDVEVIPIRGHLTDHYDPRKKVLGLSESVYNSSSVAALGIAAHETGHAVQHDTGYAFLKLRSTLVPVANIGSRLAMPLILIGILFGAMGNASYFFVDLGILFFSVSVLFTLVTLPVEFNASNRAIAMLEKNAFLDADEVEPARKVLSAAAMTYVAAAAVAVTQLLRLLFMFGGRRRD